MVWSVKFRGNEERATCWDNGKRRSESQVLSRKITRLNTRDRTMEVKCLYFLSSDPFRPSLALLR